MMSKLMEKEVHNAAVYGDVTLFGTKIRDQLLKKTYQNNNIIHVAAQHQQFHFIKAALNTFPTTPTTQSLICDLNCHGNTPLHIAAEVGDVAVIDLLYDFFMTQCGDTDDGVFPWRVMNEDGNTPAHAALIYGNVSAAMYLVDRDEYVARVLNHSKETLLHLAVRYHVFDNYESQEPETQAPSNSKEVYQSRDDLWSIIELLLKIESSVTCCADSDGSTPLHRATSLKPAYCILIIKVMLASCPEAAEVHDKRSGNTVLHLLTNHQVESYEQGLELLNMPQLYALRNSKNHEGDTPLHLAARNRDIIMVRALLEFSPKIGLMNKSGVSASSLLQQLEEIRITEKPIEHGRKLTKEECEAAQEGNVGFLNERLMSIGMNFLVSQTSKGSNILHILMQCEFDFSLLEQTEEFIGKAIQNLPILVSQQDCNGDTPIHVLVHNSSSIRLLDMVCMHLERVQQQVEDGLHSQPWRLKNGKGDTPLHVAVRHRNYDCAMKLLELDEEVAGYVNNRNQNPLHLLSHDKDCDDASVVRGLIRRLTIGNAEIPYMQDEDGLTPLLIAVRERSTSMILNLHSHFPESTKIANFQGRTLWHVFVSRRLERNYLSAHDFELTSPSCDFLIEQDQDFGIRSLMESKDNDGNTPLHLAIVNRHFGFAQFFLDNSNYLGTFRDRYNGLLEVENNEGVSCYDLIGSADHLPREFENCLFTKGNLLYGHRSLYGVPTTNIEGYANTIGVIAALLATITFTAAFTVPGGVDSSNGTPLLLQEKVFQVFMVADVVAMCTSMIVLFCLLWIMTTSNKGESLLLLDVSVFLLQASFHATLVTFMTGLYVTTIKLVPAIAISTCVTCTLLIILMHKRLVMLTVAPLFGILIILGRMLGHLSSVPSLFERRLPAP